MFLWIDAMSKRVQARQDSQNHFYIDWWPQTIIEGTQTSLMSPVIVVT